MKFCTNCGNELEEDSIFCQSCGHKLEEKVTKIQTIDDNKVEKKEIKIDSQKLILTLGVFLVLFASFIFGFITWNSMSSIVKIIFFICEGLLFFGIAFVFNKINKNMSRLFTILGFLMIPYILSLIPFYNFTNDYLSNGQGLYVYLAICYLFTFIVFLLSNIKFKSIIVTVLSFLFLLASFVFFALAISETLSVVILFVILYLFVLEISSVLKLFGNNSKVIDYTSIISLYSVSILLLLNYFIKDSSVVYNLISTIVLMITSFIHLFNNKKSVFGFICPIYIPILYCCYIFSSFGSDFLCLHVIAIFAITTYLLFTFIQDDVKLISLTITYIQLIILPLYLLIYGDINGVNLFQDITILLSITFAFNFIELFISKNGVMNYILPVNAFLLIISIFNVMGGFDYRIVTLITTSVFLLIYIILKIIKSRYSNAYLYISIVTSSLCLLSSNGGVNTINIIIPIVFGLIFVLGILFKEKNYIKIPAYILSNIALIVLFKDLKILYSIMIISSVTLIITLTFSMISKFNFKPYILYSEILILISLLFNSFTSPIIIPILLVIIYLLGLYSVIKFYNYKAYRIVYIIFGLLFIIRLITFLIEPVVLSSIISVSAILVLLTILYLLDVEDGFTIGLLSIVCVIPYYNLISNELGSEYELYVAPLVVYTIILTETYKFSNATEKKVATLVPLITAAYSFITIAFFHNDSTTSIIYDLVLATVYIILGLYRRYTSITITGIAIIIITLFIKLFTILNSVAIVVSLILIGFILIGLSLFIELRKKKE